MLKLDKNASISGILKEPFPFFAFLILSKHSLILVTKSTIGISKRVSFADITTTLKDMNPILFHLQMKLQVQSCHQKNELFLQCY